MPQEETRKRRMLRSPRTFPVRCSSSATAHFAFFCFLQSRMDAKPRTLSSDGNTLLISASRTPPRQVHASGEAAKDGTISLQEWRGWGCVSPVPTMVTEVIEDLKLLEEDVDAPMSFGGTGGKLQGEFKVEEDKKHRAKYQALGDSEKKLQFFAARQIACRLLGSRNYLCQKCWLPMEDCMCSKLLPCSLWHGMRFWVYMHPKDFLRQNNTGKLLWQLFGAQAATLCLFGIAEDEEIMWNTFRLAGKSKVWCLYPNKSALTESVQDTFSRAQFQSERDSIAERNEDRILNFVLIDGTWSNSAAMVRRLKEQAKIVWGEDDLPCISLATGASAMHKLRPQPSWDRTCTAAAAIGIMTELQAIAEFSSYGLDKQAESVEDALQVLLEALTARRLRMGRSITRKVRHTINIC